MKSLNEIRSTQRIVILQDGADGGNGFVHLLSSKKPHPACVAFSWGCGWDHVSVSFSNRCPTWEEMCEVKRLFFAPEECVVQYHPAEEEYVNDFPYCLHLWKCQDDRFPTPPTWMVGRKKEQTDANVLREIVAAIGSMRLVE